MRGLTWSPESVPAFARMSQIPVAQVLLLTGIAAFLSVMTHEWRGIDRTRAFDCPHIHSGACDAATTDEVCTLHRRVSCATPAQLSTSERENQVNKSYLSMNKYYLLEF